jgi:ATPase family associated with various cellular activities (AAA)
METKSQKTRTDISALLRARNTLLWIATREELRAERTITDAAGDASCRVAFWDVATGLSFPAGADYGTPDRSLDDPNRALEWLDSRPTGETGERWVLVMRDVDQLFNPLLVRALRSWTRVWQSRPRNSIRAVVLLTPSAEIPLALKGNAVFVDFPLPDRAEISSILSDLLEIYKDAAPNGVREAAIDAAVGLTADEAANCYTRSLVLTKKIDPAIVSSEKKRVIANIQGVTWYDPDPRGLDAIGGLDIAKAWALQRRLAFSKAAREYGLQSPKGALLVGPPGTGKSLFAKCIATAWGQPLLRLDVGALRSKYVGESEGNIRRALAIAETIAPCVLWLDEIEKALGGSSGPQGDGGVSSDALGAILSWMQDQKGVFVIATSNDVTALPPELLRKGRFDELFFVDLPTRGERAEILRVALKAYGRDLPVNLLGSVVDATADFTGAEISALVPDALFAAFADGAREITSEDILTAAKGCTPLAKTAGEKIAKLRDWAKGRTRRASTPEAEATTRKVRDIDIG